MKRLNESFGIYEDDEKPRAIIESKKYYCSLCGKEYCPNIGSFCSSCWQKIIRSKVPEEFFCYRCYRNHKNIPGIKKWIQEWERNRKKRLEK